MRNRNPEGFCRLACQCPAACIRDGAGSHNRDPTPQFFKFFFDREQSSLQIERIECCLNKKEIGATFDERGDLCLIGLFNLRPGDIPLTRIMDIAGDREGSVKRPDRTGHVPLPVRIPPHDVLHRISRQARSGPIDLGYEILKAEIRLCDDRRVEGVGLNDISTRRQVVVVNFLDNVGSCETQNIVIIFQIYRMVGKARASIIFLAKFQLLDHGSQCAVENQNPLLERINDIEGVCFGQMCIHGAEKVKLTQGGGGAKNRLTHQDALMDYSKISAATATTKTTLTNALLWKKALLMPATSSRPAARCS